MPKKQSAGIGIPKLPGIPGLGDLWDQVQDLVNQSIGAVFGGLVRYIWAPLRPFLQPVADTLRGAISLATATAGLLTYVSFRLLHFFTNAPAIVAGWLIRGFLDWIDDVVDLVEDYVDSHWEDPI